MTPVQAKTLDVVRERLEAGLSPSFADIGRACGISTTTAFHRVTALIEAGFLTQRTGKYRSLALVDPIEGCRLRAASTEALTAELARRGKSFTPLSDRGGFDRRVVTCAAECCSTPLRRGQLFCRDHWFALPDTLQKRIMSAFGAKDEAAYEAAFLEARSLIERVRN